MDTTDYNTRDDHPRHDPFCKDQTCWCHSSSDYHGLVIGRGATDEEIARAYAFFGITKERQKI